MKLKTCFLLVTMAYFGITVAQENDSIYTEIETNDIDDEVVSNLDANLDSLLHLWYVNNAPIYDSSSFLEIDEDTTALHSDISDSVYIERLSRIPSQVQLTFNKVVKRYIEVYSQQRRNQVEVMLGLANYYFPIFDDIFDYYGVPNELKYMSIIESALNPGAYSRARAVGLWQFMYGTGKFYGLTINSYVDERRDPIKATHAACQFVNDLYKIYGDWTLVIAAYNCGPGNVNKAIRRSGGKRNYWDIYYYLPRETRGHVPAFIAATYIMHYYQEHQLKPAPVSLPIPSDTVMVSDELHLKQVSEVLDIPLKQLTDINPQYHQHIIPGKHKPYALRLPLEKTTSFIDLQDSIFAYKDSVFFNPNAAIKAPSVNTTYSYQPPPADKYDLLYYTIKSGDNLGYIASWYNVGVSELRRWNNIYRNMIRSGQKLKVYVPKSKTDHYRRVNDMTFAEKQKMIGKEVKPQEKVQWDETQYTVYVVQRGDTFWEIAKKFPGVSDTDIMQWNNISSPSSLKEGDKLKIKKPEKDK